MKSFTFALLMMAVFQAPAAAEDLNTCVINGLRGVTSDVAARMVRQACESKVAGQRQRELSSKYGEQVDDELKKIDFSIDRAQGAVVVTVKNELQQTALYVELGVAAPDAKNECPWSYSRKYLYEVRMKPGC